MTLIKIIIIINNKMEIYNKYKQAGKASLNYTYTHNEYSKRI
ncbi:hypothetical protein MCSV2_70045 [Mucispirillum schaedleri ASF457]|nr:hypothetical protein MCSV2_70045 [Mucispirillum schaedleri ASF457]